MLGRATSEPETFSWTRFTSLKPKRALKRQQNRRQLPAQLPFPDLRFRFLAINPGFRVLATKVSTDFITIKSTTNANLSTTPDAMATRIISFSKRNVRPNADRKKLKLRMFA